MKKVWLLAGITYRRYIRSSTFLILTFGLPLLMVIVGVVSAISVMDETVAQLGYVNQNRQLTPLSQISVDDQVITLTAYETPAEAETALAQDEIGGYLVISADYLQGQPPTFYGPEEPGSRTNEVLTTFMRQALLADQPDWVADRLADASYLTYVDQTSGKQVVEGPALLIHIITPMVLALAFALVVLTGAGQMGVAIVREKEQRSMEMIITSLAPWELVAGKVLGITLLTMTQLAVWLIGAAIAVGLALFAVGETSISVRWEAFAWATLLGVPGYFLYAVLGAGLGIIAGDQQQARQFSGLLGMIGLVPFYLAALMIQQPDSPMAISLTLFPLTAPTFTLFRMTFTSIPAWQLLTSLLILLATLMISTWAVGRIFRSSMLLSGQTLRPKQIWQVLRQA